MLLIGRSSSNRTSRLRIATVMSDRCGRRYSLYDDHQDVKRDEMNIGTYTEPVHHEYLNVPVS